MVQCMRVSVCVYKCALVHRYWFVCTRTIKMHCDFSFNRFHELNIIVSTHTPLAVYSCSLRFASSFTLPYAPKTVAIAIIIKIIIIIMVARFCTSFARIFYAAPSGYLDSLYMVLFSLLAWHALLHLTDTRRANTMLYVCSLIVMHVRMRKGAHALAQSPLEW